MSQYVFYTLKSPKPTLPPLSAEPHSRSRSQSRFRIVPVSNSSSRHSLPRPHPPSHKDYLSSSDQTILHPSSSRVSLTEQAHDPLATSSTTETSEHDLNGQRPRLSSRHRTRSLVFLSVFALMGFTLPSKTFDMSSTTAASTTSAWSSAVDTQIIHQPIHWEHVIGRGAAWTVSLQQLPSKTVFLIVTQCALLYFTSRLPQCWLNFRRKSCEGLSMLLFAAAFLGNVTYVISILSSPALKSDPGFLAESAPYLIGSGGTVGFDLSKLVSSNECAFLLFSLLILLLRSHSHSILSLPSSASNTSPQTQTAAKQLFFLFFFDS